MSPLARAALAGSLIAATAAPSEAGTELASARELHERGKAHYRAERYERAAALFLRAHKKRPLPGLVFNAAQAYRRARNCRRAATLYRDYLIAAPRTPNRAVVEAHVAEMDRCVARRQSALRAEVTRANSPWRTAGWISTGVGAGLMASAGLLAWDAKSASPERGGDRSKTLAWITGTAGTGAVAAGVAMLLRTDHEVGTPQLEATEGGAIVGWSWSL